jgi:hypothetical protein
VRLEGGGLNGAPPIGELRLRLRRRHAVHREGNPADEEARIVVVRSGSGESVFNVDGPEPVIDM